MDKVIKRESRDTEVREDVAKNGNLPHSFQILLKKLDGPIVGFEFLY
jgi:hypothetical protein